MNTVLRGNFMVLHAFFFFRETKIISKPTKQTSLAFNLGNWKKAQTKGKQGD